MKSSSFLKQMDFAEMEARFSNDHSIKYEEFNDSSVAYEEIKPFLDRLPPREIDLIELYYNDHKNQKDIAKMFGVTQGAISSRLSRAKKRLRFLRDLPKISDKEIDERLGGMFDVLDVAIIKSMMKTTCQSKTAYLMNAQFELVDIKKRMTQVKVRHRFEKCLFKLEAQMCREPDLKKYHHLLLFIKGNLYKLHEVKLPHFDRANSVLLSIYE